MTLSLDKEVVDLARQYANRFLGNCVIFRQQELIDFAHAVAEAAVKQHASVEVTRQYFYRVNNCPTLDSNSPDCTCWHDKGTGPIKNNPEWVRTWRDKPRPQASAAVPEKKTGPIARTLEGYGYVNGWNACIDAMLTNPLETKNVE